MKQSVLPQRAEGFETYSEAVASVCAGACAGASMTSGGADEHFGEPCLCDLINDDLLRRVMDCDRVEQDSLHLLIDETRERLGL